MSTEFPTYTYRAAAGQARVSTDPYALSVCQSSYVHLTETTQTVNMHSVHPTYAKRITKNDLHERRA